MAEIAQALYNPIAYQSQLERRTRQLSVFEDEDDEQPVRRVGAIVCSLIKAKVKLAHLM